MYFFFFNFIFMSDGCCLVPLFLTAFNFWFIYVLLVVSFFYYGIGICFLLCVAILRHFLARLFFISWFFASNRARFYLYTVHDLSWLKGNWWKRRYFKTHACVWVTVRHNIWWLDMTLSDNHCSVCAVKFNIYFPVYFVSWEFWDNI